MVRLPDLSHEELLWGKGFKIVAGLDEVGRGPFAGPVVAAAVAFASDQSLGSILLQNSVVINDSKKLTAKQREIADSWIRQNALGFGIGVVGIPIINKQGIKKAAEIAFRMAIKNTRLAIDYLLIDAFVVPQVKGIGRKNQHAIIKGDGISVSIAAASILAKVYRDKLMVSLDAKPAYKKYDWGRNKGYGTKAHRDAILTHGITKLHRTRYVENWLKNSKIKY